MSRVKDVYWAVFSHQAEHASCSAEASRKESPTFLLSSLAVLIPARAKMTPASWAGQAGRPTPQVWGGEARHLIWPRSQAQATILCWVRCAVRVRTQGTCTAARSKWYFNSPPAAVFWEADSRATDCQPLDQGQAALSVQQLLSLIANHIDSDYQKEHF